MPSSLRRRDRHDVCTTSTSTITPIPTSGTQLCTATRSGCSNAKEPLSGTVTVKTEVSGCATANAQTIVAPHPITILAHREGWGEWDNPYEGTGVTVEVPCWNPIPCMTIQVVLHIPISNDG